MLAIGATGTTLLAAAFLLVHRRPGTAFGFVGGYATILVALFDVFGLALLLVGVGLFAASSLTLQP